MHKGHYRNREADIYDTYEEVCESAYNPPRYCDKCGKELMYFSFFDSMNRFTLKAGCRTCRDSHAISVKKEKYEQRMLDHWTKMIKERAENRCEMANEKCSGELHAHHIIPKHLDPGKKYDVENGICLCAAHHKMIHHYM
mgnify:CR=1 FL=1